MNNITKKAQEQSQVTNSRNSLSLSHIHCLVSSKPAVISDLSPAILTPPEERHGLPELTLIVFVWVRCPSFHCGGVGGTSHACPWSYAMVLRYPGSHPRPGRWHSPFSSACVCFSPGTPVLCFCVDDSGLLVHCISGWDRTPLFISLLRLSLWAVSTHGLGWGSGSLQRPFQVYSWRGLSLSLEAERIWLEGPQVSRAGVVKFDPLPGLWGSLVVRGLQVWFSP